MQLFAHLGQLLPALTLLSIASGCGQQRVQVGGADESNSDSTSSDSNRKSANIEIWGEVSVSDDGTAMNQPLAQLIEEQTLETVLPSAPLNQPETQPLLLDDDQILGNPELAARLHCEAATQQARSCAGSHQENSELGCDDCPRVEVFTDTFVYYDDESEATWYDDYTTVVAGTPVTDWEDSFIPEPTSFESEYVIDTPYRPHDDAQVEVCMNMVWNGSLISDECLLAQHEFLTCLSTLECKGYDILEWECPIETDTLGCVRLTEDLRDEIL